jgi:hypothetical protein
MEHWTFRQILGGEFNVQFDAIPPADLTLWGHYHGIKQVRISYLETEGSAEGMLSISVETYHPSVMARLLEESRVKAEEIPLESRETDYYFDSPRLRLDSLTQRGLEQVLLPQSTVYEEGLCHQESVDSMEKALSVVSEALEVLRKTDPKVDELADYINHEHGSSSTFTL